MAIGRVDYKKSTNLESVASAITSMGQRASKKDKPEILGQKIKAISTDATAIETKVLQGETFYAGGQKKVGSMVNQGAINTTLNAGGNYVIPQGYHNGSGKIVANSLASQTSATATASNILSGKTAYVNGNKITGTIQSKGAQTYTPKTTNQTIGAGQYLSGAQTILGDPNLVPANIKSGKTIFGVKGSFVGENMMKPLIYEGGYKNGFSFVNANKKINVSAREFIPCDFTQRFTGYIPNTSENITESAFLIKTQINTNITHNICIRSNSPVDLTGYKSLTFLKSDSNKIGLSYLDGHFIVGFAPLDVIEAPVNSYTEGFFQGTGFVSYFKTSTDTIPLYRGITLDVSNVSGSYYLCLAMDPLFAENQPIWIKITDLILNV